MTWNVRIHDVVGGRWVGVVDGRDEDEARIVALLRFNIRSDVDFSVTPQESL